jgi:nitric oxide reductase NorD protein
MAEPEEIIIDAARHATAFVSRLWHSGDPKDDNNALTACKNRLELLLAAVHGYEIPVHVAQPPAPPSALSRLFERAPRHLIEPYALPANDAARIFLPMRLASDGPPPLQLFRILAVQQAARAQRRASHTYPVKNTFPKDGLVQDLFYISEATAVDHALTLELPGLTQDLIALRHATLSERPQPRLLNMPERAIEELYCQVLRAHPAFIPSSLIPAQIPGDSLTWAIATAEQMLAEIPAGIARKKIRYRGIRKGLWLGRTLPAVAQRQSCSIEPTPDGPDTLPGPQRNAQLARRPEVREKKKDEDDHAQGMWMLQMDDPQQHVEDPAGMQRPTDRDDNANAGDLADSLSELPEASLIASSKPAQEVLLSDNPLNGRTLLSADCRRTATGISYPEWDFRISGYRQHGVIVRLRSPLLGGAAWAESVLARHRTLLREIQRRFEGMQPRRTRRRRQPDGNDVDIGAYVSAYAEQRAGLPLQDRLYQSVRPARGDIAIALLIDISASTDGWVSHDLRIIDVEKEALLLVHQALMALGDPFCIQAFSGESAQDVSLWALKGFDENGGRLVQRRIAALEPQRYTRAGAAIRHTASLLAACAAEHRLLILLSDGKPNDVDQYEGRYGVEDMRQAVAEATLQSIHPFCITVDRHAPQYLAGIFGPGRYAVLQHPQLLPVVLVDVLRKLIRT